MNNFQAIRSLTSAHSSALMNQLRMALIEKRFATIIIFAFLAVYAIAAYLLVSAGLSYVQKLPLIGVVLIERMLYLLYFFFFVMLVLSNATITGIGLFRRQETSWLLTLPVPHESLAVWRTIEGLALSSWGLILLSAPILAAFGGAFHAGFAFYFHSLPAIICLITIAANLSTWLLMIIVCFYRSWSSKAAIAGAVVVVISVSIQLKNAQVSHFASSDVAANVRQILGHTQICTHPLLPSTWVAKAAISAAHEAPATAWFYSLTLLSYALVCWLITLAITRRLFYPAWNRHLNRNEERTAKVKKQTTLKDVQAFWERTPLRFLMRRHTRALVSKDIRTFLREPMQWGQCAIIFSLLFLYTWNLRNLGYNTADPLWSAIVSYLNLTVCCLATSTLTTRFIFPQFSLEGQRLWILGLAPFSLTTVLRQKLLLNLTASAPLTALLVTISSFSLSLPMHRMSYFVSAMVLISFGLTTLALGLGALLPNFRENNPAKIVSGFGGTLCLVLSFLYIVGSIFILVIPAVLERTSSSTPPYEKIIQYEYACLAGVILLTLFFGVLPYIIAKKRIKELAYLGYL